MSSVLVVIAILTTGYDDDNCCKCYDEDDNIIIIIIIRDKIRDNIYSLLMVTIRLLRLSIKSLSLVWQIFRVYITTS